MAYLFNKVIIVGVGLIGGSLGMEILRRKLAPVVIGVGRSRANLKVALAKRAIRKGCSPQQFINQLAGADLIILATPVRSVAGYFSLLRSAARQGNLSADLIVTDVGSTKRGIVRQAERLLPAEIPFVGGHPIAGTEHSGAQAAWLGLFRNKICILTPGNKTNRRAVKKITELWKAVGSQVITLSPEIHDARLGAVSHLPHMVAYALVHTVLRQPQALRLGGGGFRDFTRIAASDPVMWRDIGLENGAVIQKNIRALERELKVIKKMLARNEGEKLRRYFVGARKV